MLFICLIFIIIVKFFFLVIFIEKNVEVICGDIVYFKVDIWIEEFVFLFVSWEKVDGFVRKYIDIGCEKYKGSIDR